ncbi:type VI secretion system Vgr family protein [Sedimentisphaera salicampi]|uniref:Type VI secretion system Vgr family protein n=1 Tax=Sedimentisphaera salicampi TaxID=1941349 RepID=A0A1W6LMB9_9BACT|nr:type VI secretion system tip protein TssI/VgrG [Sedimentisphaera salicampi]ARN56919.1 type VI secretion system Vgr family protein [Sedimentisphaera salicampi]
MAEFTQKHREIAIGTPLGDDVFLIQSLKASERIGDMFLFEADLLSLEDVAAEDIIGKNVSIRFNCGDSMRFFNGYVKEFTFVSKGKEFSEYRAAVVPWLWFLDQNQDCRIFQNLAIPEIIEEVFKSRNISDYQLSLSGSYDKLEYCVQYRESDYNFIKRLMEFAGIYFYFEHQQDKHVLVICDSSNAHSTFEDYEKIKFKLESDQEYEEVIVSWQRKMSVLPNKVEMKDYNFQNSKQDLLSKSDCEGKGVDGNMGRFFYPAGFEEMAAGDKVADIRLQQIRAGEEVCIGKSYSKGLRPGYIFKMEGCPQQGQNREYLTLETNYKIEAGGFETGLRAHDISYHCNFKTMPTEIDYRLPPTAEHPRIEGPQTAFVTGPSGDEIYTDKHGRVKVVFHWDRYGKPDENSSCWVRVSQGLAGNKWGMIALPRVGQEVIVEFEEGDPDRPIITGRVYNGQNAAPYSLPKNKTISTSKTNSSKGGGGFNEIRFEDKKGSEQLFVHAERDKDEYVGNNSYTTIDDDSHTTVEGKRFERTKKDYHDRKHKDYFEEIGGDKNLSVSGNSVANVSKNSSVQVSQTHQLNAKEIIQETSTKFSQKSKEHVVEANTKYSAKGKEVCIEAASNLCLKAGSSVISLSSSGININGSMVKINSGAYASASGKAASYSAPKLAHPAYAVDADDGSPGALGKPKDLSGLEPDIVQLLAQKAPEYVPAPDIALGYMEGVEAAAGAGAGAGITRPDKKFIPILKCSHGRVSGPSGILEVVATRNRKFNPLTVGGSEEEIGDDEMLENDYNTFSHKPKNRTGNEAKKLSDTANKVNRKTNKVSKHTKWLPKLEFTVRDGESDEITALVNKANGTKVNDAKAQIVSRNASLKKSADKKVPVHRAIHTPQSPYGTTETIFDFSLFRFLTCLRQYRWITSNCCEKYTVNYLMPDKSIDKLEIHSYPATSVKIKISTDFISKLVSSVSDKFFNPLERVLSKGPISVEFDLEVATGFVSFEYYWREAKDWRCCLVRKAEAGLDPLLGIGLVGKASLLAIAGMFFGIPPAISKFLGKALADIYLFLDIALELILKGSAEYLTYYYPSKKEEIEGKLSAIVGVPLEIGLEAKLGNEYVAYLELKGSFATRGSMAAHVIAEEDLIGFRPEIKTDPVVGKLSYKATALWIFDRSDSIQTTIVEEKVIYSSSELVKIWPVEENN